MGDIEPPRGKSLVPLNAHLKKQQTEIQINEKVSIVDALKIRLRDLEEIEAKKIRFQMQILQNEIDFLKDKQNQIVDVNGGDASEENKENENKQNQEVNGNV